MNDKDRRQAARKFVEFWIHRRGSEKGEDQQFWNSLLRDVLGIEDVERCIQFQVPVPMKGTTKFLDAWIPETRVLIEHKSHGVNLDAPQSGHGGLTPYEQAAEYDAARPFDEKARWIVTCNFDEFRIYDRAKPLAPPLSLKLGNLPKEAYRLAFLVNPKEKAVDRELEISVQAGRIVGEIYDALLKQYDNVANVKMLPIANSNAQSDSLSQLGTGNIGTGNTSTMATISKTAQAILDARARYPESSLADLYDPLTMPPDLRAAHEANDRAVLAAYGLAPDTPEPEIVAHLFKLYAAKEGKSP